MATTWWRSYLLLRYYKPKAVALVKRCGLLWSSRKGTHGEEDRRKPSYGYLEEWNDVYVSTVMDVFTLYWSFAIPDRQSAAADCRPSVKCLSKLCAMIAATNACSGQPISTNDSNLYIYLRQFVCSHSPTRLGRWLIHWTQIGILVFKVIWSLSKFKIWAKFPQSDWPYWGPATQ